MLWQTKWLPSFSAVFLIFLLPPTHTHMHTSCQSLNNLNILRVICYGFTRALRKRCLNFLITTLILKESDIFRLRWRGSTQTNLGSFQVFLKTEATLDNKSTKIIKAKSCEFLKITKLTEYTAIHSIL